MARTSAPDGNIIDVRGLGKRFGRITALDDLTLSVAPGEIVGFLGPNGAGKTTAIKILLGLTKPTTGDGRVLGAPLGDREARRRIGYLPELFRYQPWLTAREVLTLHARLAGVPARERDANVARVLDAVGLAARGRDRVAGFSKGMQQRLGLAVALVADPLLVVLDEPTSALDPVGRSDVREIVRELRARGTTVLLNSHLLTEVERVCDRVAIVDRGRIIASGPIDAIAGESRSVRLRFHSARNERVEQTLRRFGEVGEDPPWTIVRGIDSDDVPVLVTALVEAGAQIGWVEPLHATLEDRFLELLRRPHSR